MLFFAHSCIACYSFIMFVRSCIFRISLAMPHDKVSLYCISWCIVSYCMRTHATLHFILSYYLSPYCILLPCHWSRHKMVQTAQSATQFGVLIPASCPNTQGEVTRSGMPLRDVRLCIQCLWCHIALQSWFCARPDHLASVWRGARLYSGRGRDE
jgi:hypothetical protein